ncbi:MAG: hypothetical protein ABSC22_13850 [Roseiarcus sp.]|jgi:hypothetical protein
MAIGSLKLVSWAALLLLAAGVAASAATDAAPRKYEFVTSDTKVEDGHKLTRVRLISSGVLGGYIESESNLSQAGACFLDDQSRAYGNARITDDAQLHGLARDSARLSDRAKVYGAIYGNAQVKDDAVVYGQVYDDAVVDGFAAVHGQVFGAAKVGGHARVYGRIYGAAEVRGDETVYGERH